MNETRVAQPPPAVLFNPINRWLGSAVRITTPWLQLCRLSISVISVISGEFWF